MVTDTEQVTVLIADDHPVYRSGLARMIIGRDELDLVAQAESGQEALAAIREHAPQVAVVDLKMPDMDGIALLGEIKREGLETRVVVLTGYATGEKAYDVMAAGAAAYISKAAEPWEVCETIVKVASGGTYLSPEFHGDIVSQIQRQSAESAPVLSEREHEVLRLTADGNSIAEIGKRLEVSAATVKTHLQHSYRKLGVSDRAAAVAEGMRRGLLD